MSKCKAIGCDEELTGRKVDYCSNRCKQKVKYAIKTGRQCRVCRKEIKRPVPVLGGFRETCGRHSK